MPDAPPTEKVIRAYQKVLEEWFEIMRVRAAGGPDTTPERAQELYRKTMKAEELLGPALARVVEKKTMQIWEQTKKTNPLSGEPEVPF